MVARLSQFLQLAHYAAGSQTHTFLAILLANSRNFLKTYKNKMWQIVSAMTNKTAIFIINRHVGIFFMYLIYSKY